MLSEFFREQTALAWQPIVDKIKPKLQQIRS